MSRIHRGANPAAVRWVHHRRNRRARRRQMFGWVLECRSGPPRRAADVHVAHICRVASAERRTVCWLDEDQRCLIAPLALWDVTDQLRTAAALFKLRTRS